MSENQRQWTPVGGGQQSGNQRWKPQENLNYNPNDPGNFLQGYFKDLVERVSQTGSPFMVAEIVLVNQDGSLGDTIDVSGGKTLTKQLDDIPLGSFIGIKYCGKERSKSTGFTYNNWETFKDPGAIPFQQLGGHLKTRTATPQNQPPVVNNQPWNQTPVQQMPANNQPPVQQMHANQQQHNPAPNGFQQTMAPPTFNPPVPVQQQTQPFNPPPQFNNAPVVNNQPYIPPAQITQPAVVQQPVQSNPAQFGGQPIVGNPFDKTLPF